MLINIDKSGTHEGFEKIIDKSLSDPETKSLFILACDGNGITPEIIDPILKQIPVPVFGGIFPCILYGNEKLGLGTIVIGLTKSVEINTISGLSDNQSDFVSQIDKFNTNVKSNSTIFVFVDGFANRISSLY